MRMCWGCQGNGTRILGEGLGNKDDPDAPALCKWGRWKWRGAWVWNRKICQFADALSLISRSEQSSRHLSFFFVVRIAGEVGPIISKLAFNKMNEQLNNMKNNMAINQKNPCIIHLCQHFDHPIEMYISYIGIRVPHIDRCGPHTSLFFVALLPHFSGGKNQRHASGKSVPG